VNPKSGVRQIDVEVACHFLGIRCQKAQCGIIGAAPLHCVNCEYSKANVLALMGLDLGPADSSATKATWHAERATAMAAWESTTSGKQAVAALAKTSATPVAGQRTRGPLSLSQAFAVQYPQWKFFGSDAPSGPPLKNSAILSFSRAQVYKQLETRQHLIEARPVSARDRAVYGIPTSN
jgi:hypothetical protein